MSEKMLSRILISGLLFLFVISIIATFYNSIVLGNFNYYGVAFYENDDLTTEVVFFYNNTEYSFITTETEYQEQVIDLKNKFGDIFPDEFYTEYKEFYTDYYSYE